jgi:6-phosphofructokinase 1
MVVEVMGRHAGWIAAYAGLASGANLILVPEESVDLNDVAAFLRKRHASGATASIVIVGEGCNLKDHPASNMAKVDEFGHVRLGGIGDVLARELEKRVGIETRAVVLGHIVRGGPPSAYDRILATRLGVAAMQCVKDGEFGVMVAVRGNVIAKVPLVDILGKMKNLDKETLAITKDFSL